jgi:hypothetical protein
MPLKGDVSKKDTKEKVNVENHSALIQVTTLPSKFLPYPKGSEIHYQSFSYGDISQMNQSKVSFSVKIDMALKGIETKGFEKEDITYFDFQYISLLRRASTFQSSEYSINYICRNNECNKTNSDILPLTKFEFIDLEVPRFPIKVKFSNDMVLNFRPLTLRDYKSLFKISKANDDVAIATKQSDCKDFTKTYNFIKQAKGKDLLILNKVDKYLNHGVKRFELECKHCGFINSISKGEDDVVIIPFRNEEDALGDVISFG